MTYLQIIIILTGFLAAHTQFYQSYVEMTTFGFEVQPWSPSDQLGSFVGMRNVNSCASQCNQQQLCRYFDYDTSTGACRIFLDGTVVASTMPTSQVGTVLYMPDLYASHGQPCTWNNCQINRYLICDSTNTCQCRTGLFWNATMCTVTTTAPVGLGLSLYGVQLDLDPSSLPNGWSLCYNDTYALDMNAILPTILSTCNKAKLLLGCRSVGNFTLNVAAMGLRADVLYNCSTLGSCTNVANGVGWYYSNVYSWGFVNSTDMVIRNQCDEGSTNPAYRLCWHTIPSVGGYRCGAAIGLNSDTTTERVIYHSD